ncbi:MAG: response regulator [Treponema sp.]|nr:response regulator [Treponema sp.]
MKFLRMLKIIREEFLHVLAVFLVFVFMIFIAVYFIRMVKDHLVENIESVLDTAEEVVYANFHVAEIAVLSAADSVQNYLNDNYSREQIRTYIEELSNHLTMPSSIDTPGFRNMYGYIYGELMTGNDWAPPEDYVVEERPWYIAALRAGGDIGYTAPYVDKETGEIVVSTAKLLNGGSEPRIIVVDVYMNDISAYITNLKSGSNGYGMLVDQDFVYIAHPNESSVGKHIYEFNAKQADLEKELINGVKNYSGVILTGYDGRKMETFFRKLEYGWYIGVAVPVDTAYHASYFIVFVFLAAAFIFILILNYIVTKMNKARVKADQENKIKTSFLARMSHEIRTPMNVIISLVEVILRKNIADDVREQLMIVKQSSATLLALINDILDFSKMEAGQLQLEVKNYNITSLINDVASIIRMRITGKPVDLVIHEEDDVPSSLIGDEVRVKQILINLLTNGVKYTQAGQVELHVSVKKKDAAHLTLFFKVSDTGIGIKQKDMERLFTEFSRVDTKRNRDIEGTGLGLAIVRNLCKAMGGDITVSSVYEQGSVFTVSLLQGFVDGKPALEEQKPEAANENTPPFVAPNAHVLVVDDIDTNLMVAEELLKFFELRIDTCTSGDKALRLVRENFYDLVFMDHMMPEMDGIETTRRIRAMGEDDPYFRQMPIVALTANALVEYRELFLQSGFNDFLAKPIEVEKLCDILKKWLSPEKRQAANTLRTSKADAGGADELTISNIDVQAGISNTGGSLSSYLRVLRIFCNDAEDRAVYIKNAAAEGDTKLYTTMVHALKSASRSLGATEFGDFAEAMEAAGRARDIPIIRRRTGELLNQLYALLANIKNFLNQNTAEVESGDTRLSKEQLEDLMRALSDMKVSELDRLITAYKALPISRAAKDALESIEEDILLFEYEKAAAEINEMVSMST